MAIKLRSLFRGPQSALLLKAILFGGFLSLAKIGNMGILPVFFFIIAGCVLYATPFFHNMRFPVSFIVLVASSLLTVSLFERAALWIWCVLFFSFLFYVFLGIKNLQFVYRKRWHYIVLLALTYFLSLFFFLKARETAVFVLGSLGIFAAATGMLREYFAMNERETMPKAPLRMGIAAVLGFCMAQILMAASLLPFGFLNAANLSLLAFFVLVEVVVRYFGKNLSRKILLLYLTLFVILALFVFSTSRWTV